MENKIEDFENGVFYFSTESRSDFGKQLSQFKADYREIIITAITPVLKAGVMYTARTTIIGYFVNTEPVSKFHRPERLINPIISSRV